jgi:hypothetical protein
MPDLSDKDRRDVLGEVLADQLQLILEYVQEIPAIKADVAQLKVDVAALKRIVQNHELDIRFIRRHLALN